MKKIVFITLIFVLNGCASTVCMKTDQVMVPGYGLVTALSIESNNGTSNNLKVIQTYSKGEKTGEYSYGNDGILYPIISGGMQAGGMIGGAALLRPDKNETNVSGVSNAQQIQGQVQGQIQGQMQSVTNKPVFNNSTNKPNLCGHKPCK